MTVSAPDLAAYVKVPDADDEYVASCLDQAQTMVATLIGSAVVPMPLSDRAVLETGAELYNRRDATNGYINNFTTDSGGAARVRVDPLIPARALLSPYLGFGFA
jgi:hypothetical protein